MVGCGLGEGLEPALQGLITYLVNSTQTVELFMTLAVCDTIAELVGGPITAQLMDIGRRPGHASDGICFLTSSVCPSLFFKIKNKKNRRVNQINRSWVDLVRNASWLFVVYTS